MDRKQVIVVSLLVIAVVLATASVLMNAQILNQVDSQKQSAPNTANVVFEITEPEEGAETVLADEGSEENG